MKAVIDTNIIISGFFWNGTPKKVLQAWQNRQFDLVVTEPIIDEYRAVLNRLSKKLKKPVNTDKFIQLITLYSHLYQPAKLAEQISRDPDDDKFIAAAITGKAKVIVSGDDDLLVLKSYNSIDIMQAKLFLDSL